MARFSCCKSSSNSLLFFTAFLFSLLSFLLTSHTTSAGGYTFQNPTAATRWSTGQPGLITIVSTDAAKADTPSTSRLLTITLRVSSGGIFGGSTNVAVIKDGFQLLVPPGSTTESVTLAISDWIVPATLPAGNKYFVHLARTKDGFFDFPDSVDSPTFQIVAANATTPTPTPTTTTTAPTPTQTTTCNDIKEQCAAQSKAFQPASGTTPCSCGAALIVPNIIESTNSALSSKNTFQSTGGPTAALIVLLLVVLTLF
ncbi:hypothetical protein BG015_009508 [Linnemannia schmuckeri]|uniref:Uncharacterized protein n=1 Tax=Linnemannia schmuckeri TaxID=64567 RepID=A0A9P5S815_9FUNG|nr:hypothetical protein BG015_009508 [Linnemannia schmuckeri]